jgi:hypothetical protein
LPELAVYPGYANIADIESVVGIPMVDNYECPQLKKGPKNTLHKSSTKHHVFFFISGDLFKGVLFRVSVAKLLSFSFF